MAADVIGFVEDSDEDFALLARVFARDWELERWPTGEAAVEALAADDEHLHRIAVLLVDHDLPGMNGVAVIDRVRASPGGTRPLVCMLSGTGRPGISDAALAAGADAFLVKPADVSGLRELAVHVSAMATAR